MGHKDRKKEEKGEKKEERGRGKDPCVGEGAKCVAPRCERTGKDEKIQVVIRRYGRRGEKLVAKKSYAISHSRSKPCIT